MKRVLRLLLFVLLLSLFAASQTATVKRNVNLRPDPSTDNDPITTLRPPAQLELLEPDAAEGFFHVKTSDGQEGWVWARNIRVTKGSTTVPSAEHIGPARLYPDPILTPGMADTLNVADLTRRYTKGCPRGKKSCTYSQAHRNVPAGEHKKVYDEYNVPKEARNIKHGEVDHFYPLCAGGSNEINNLWYQPAENEWSSKNFGFHEKDKLESYICVQIKAHKMDPKDAFSRIQKDWVKFYLDEGLDHQD